MQTQVQQMQQQSDLGRQRVEHLGKTQEKLKGSMDTITEEIRTLLDKNAKIVIKPCAPELKNTVHVAEFSREAFQLESADGIFPVILADYYQKGNSESRGWSLQIPVR